MCKEFAAVIRDTSDENEVLEHIEFGDMILAAIKERRVSPPDGWTASIWVKGGCAFFPKDLEPVYKGTIPVVFIMDAPEELIEGIFLRGRNPDDELGSVFFSSPNGKFELPQAKSDG